MKVAIITAIDHSNIGNRLQNYAVQELLTAHHCQPETLIYARYDQEGSFVCHAKSFLQSLLVWTRIYTSLFYLRHIKKAPKLVLTEEFNRKYMKRNYKYYYKASRMSGYRRDFDYYCVGSDQIWNPTFVQNNDFYFLKFAPSERTFAFAPSIGVSSIPEKYHKTFREGFEHIAHLSVRETRGQELIKELTNRDSLVLLDPTLLLKPEQWHKIARKPAFDLPQRYLATYFLSETTPQQQALIQDYAQKHDLQIVDINQTYASYIGPMEFLYVMAHSQFVFTDSFHGTAFSVIFGKNFLVFRRNNSSDMSSRITTILHTFRLENRFYCGDNQQLDPSIRDLIPEIENQDTRHVNVILEEKQQKAHDYLNGIFA